MLENRTFAMSSVRKKPKEQIIGIRLTPETAVAVKQEAARRHIRMNALFEEMWALYLKTTQK